ncbi:unnamed protein product [Angiostrongylus costaricensis]|uniref:Uncharacterized protein n=1 Tax=Angiostrongylus costaricensis TaxID=334426 RepID=A0A0R3PKT0_ANGCS|nr:unnamed protein product [Angiostrongylus costaricensis]
MFGSSIIDLAAQLQNFVIATLIYAAIVGEWSPNELHTRSTSCANGCLAINLTMLHMAGSMSAAKKKAVIIREYIEELTASTLLVGESQLAEFLAALRCMIRTS